jgi:hypothetical protein
MTVKNGLIVLSLVILTASCGQNSTKKTESGTDTLNTNADTSTGMEVNSTPVTGTITVPEKVQASFREKYPDVRDVSWSHHEAVNNFDWEWTGWPILDTADYLARFNYNGSDYWSWYDYENNEWVGSVANIKDYKGLPAPVNSYISTNYPGYTIDEVDQENDKNRTAYEIDLSKGEDKVTILVDVNGKLMKKKSLIDGQKTKQKNL